MHLVDGCSTNMNQLPLVRLFGCPPISYWEERTLIGKSAGGCAEEVWLGAEASGHHSKG